MKPAPPPADEAERLATLRSYGILDTAPEQDFDDLTLLASYICETPIALVSLVDSDRQWFKSKVGLDADETHRDLAFCAHAIHGRSLFVVKDATEDERFAGNPLVREDPKIRFYVGAPLVEPGGQVLGTLCVIDRVPRELRPEQSRALEALSRQTVGQMELRKKIRELQATGESLLEAKHSADEANRTKSKFLAYMSHELRTPLNAIIGFSNILLKSPSGKFGDKQRNYLDRVAANGKHLLALIDGILDIARIEAGRMELHPETFDAGELVTETVSQVESLVAARNNRLEVRGTENFGPIVADRTKLSQCLLNLLSNACKFTTDGSISLSASRRSSAGRDWICFEVADSGIGMNQDQLSSLFQEFSRAGAGAHGKTPGTGLGLAITRKICRLMGGDVTVESRPGEGSTFTIRLPALEA